MSVAIVTQNEVQTENDCQTGQVKYHFDCIESCFGRLVEESKVGEDAGLSVSFEKLG